jgi:hypothetical protein
MRCVRCEARGGCGWRGAPEGSLDAGACRVVGAYGRIVASGFMSGETSNMFYLYPRLLVRACHTPQSHHTHEESILTTTQYDHTLISPLPRSRLHELAVEVVQFERALDDLQRVLEARHLALRRLQAQLVQLTVLHPQRREQPPVEFQRADSLRRQDPELRDQLPGLRSVRRRHTHRRHTHRRRCEWLATLPRVLLRRASAHPAARGGTRGPCRLMEKLLRVREGGWWGEDRALTWLLSAYDLMFTSMS